MCGVVMLKKHHLMLWVEAWTKHSASVEKDGAVQFPGPKALRQSHRRDLLNALESVLVLFDYHLSYGKWNDSPTDYDIKCAENKGKIIIICIMFNYLYKVGLPLEIIYLAVSSKKIKDNYL